MTSKLRVLVVDDSPLNRRAIREILEASGQAEVVGEAGDGEEALRRATKERPDVVTLDLEMPKMDGFTFLRILMARRPTPVIVISSYSQKENVFKALELGALDFVEKPDRGTPWTSSGAREQIIEKVTLARALVRLRVSAPPPPMPPPTTPASRASYPDLSGIVAPPPPIIRPRWLVAIAASTGGPAALLEIFAALPGRLPSALLVAQHMPERFTKPFAERLNRTGPVRVTEAVDGEMIVARAGLVCPGGVCMQVEAAEGGDLIMRLVPQGPEDKYVPSADRLLRSVAKVAGTKAVGIVLTGMGNDGLEGARAIRQAGGQVVVESATTAVVYGMPAAVHRAGLATKVLELGAMAEFIAGL